MRKINRIFLYLSFLLSLMFPLSWLHAVSENNKVILHSASEYDYPPYSVTKDGKADGFSVELLKCVVEKINMNITFKVGPWAEIKKELIDGKLDILPLVAHSKEREKEMSFTAPYLVLYGGIFVRSDNTNIKSEADLKGKEIIVMEGDSAHEYVLNQKITDKIVITKTYLEAFKELSKGKHDAIVVQKYLGLRIIKEYSLKNIKALGSSIVPRKEIYMPFSRERELLKGFEQVFCFAVPQNSKGKALVQQLNQGLITAFRDGTFDRLFEKWFPPEEKSVDIVAAAKLIGDGSFIITIIILIIGVIALKKQVKKRTKELSNSEEKYRNLSESLNEVVYKCTPESIENIYINKAVEDILGYSTKDWIGNQVVMKEVIYSEDQKYVFTVLSEARAKVQNGAIKYRIVKKDGTIRWVENRFSWEKDIHGCVIAQIGILYDITERKRAEDVLEGRMRQLEILNKASVERELKMIELKERIKELEGG